MVSFGDMAQFAILGPMMEENLRRALLISRGNFGVFLTSRSALAFSSRQRSCWRRSPPGVLKLRQTAMATQ